MNRRWFVGALGGGAVLAAAGHNVPTAGGMSPPRPRPRDRLVPVERWSWAMGQSVHLQLFAESETHGYEAAAAALAELRRVEARLSLFDEASDLVELNRLAGRRPMRVGEDLAAVLGLALRVKRETGGGFDPAIEPLMRAWGFRSRRERPPSQRELAAAREAVRAAEVRLGGSRAFVPSAHTQLDLGGIGVGYGLDRAGAVLRAHGIRRALLDVSGDLLALGAPPGEPGWRVGIADPVEPRSLFGTFTLRDQALATSANTVQVRSYGPLLVGHVLDPTTGGSAGALRQVTVVAPSAVLADALATAALVRGAAVARGAGVVAIAV